MTSMVNPFLSLYGNQQQVPENLKNISTYKGTQQQEQQQMLANQAAGRGYASMSPQGMQQQSPYMQQPQMVNPYMQQQSPYMQQPRMINPYMQQPRMVNPYMQQQSQFNPYVGLFGGGFNPMMQQMPQMQQPRMSFQQEQQQMLANQASGRPTMAAFRPPQQQFNPYAQMGRPSMFGTTMQNPIMQAPWFQQAQRQPLMPGQYGYGNGIN